MSSSDIIERNETARIEAFSDGVFAIAITLLILDVHVPQDLPEDISLGRALLAQWPQYLAFIVSFLFIGVMWLNHHRLFTLIKKSDHGLIIWNLLLLLGATVVPFPTSLLAAYMQKPGAQTAAMVYSGLYILLGVVFLGLWQHALRRNLLATNADPIMVKWISGWYRFGPLLWLVTLLIGLVSAPLALVATGIVAAIFALPPRQASLQT